MRVSGGGGVVTQVELKGVGMNEMNYFGATFGGLFKLSSISIKRKALGPALHKHFK